MWEAWPSILGMLSLDNALHRGRLYKGYPTDPNSTEQGDNKPSFLFLLWVSFVLFWFVCLGDGEVKTARLEVTAPGTAGTQTLHSLSAK